MLKSLSHIMVAFTLACSVLAPSFLSLFHSEMETIVFMDASEKESESKIEIDKEEKILQDFAYKEKGGTAIPKKNLHMHYLESHSGCALDILVPPPEPTV